MQELHTSEPSVYDVAAELHKALEALYVEELNGRLCALPDTLGDPWGENGETNRESRCCAACARHWDRVKKALKAYEQFKERSIAS